MITFFKYMFGNPAQDLLIYKFELLLASMNANTSKEYEYIKTKLSTIK